MNFKIEAICDVGRVRKNNEDMILIGDQLIRDEIVEYTIDATERNFWIAVSDGMGGHNAGELASETVLKKISEIGNTISNDLSADELTKYLEVGIRSIHKDLNLIGSTDGSLKGLGATFTGLLVYQQKTFIVNIGDSRLYRLRGGLLAQLTNDHTLRNLLNDPSIPPNQLANSFGGASDKIFFDLEEIKLMPGDVILLCTDGLSGELNNQDIEDLLNTKQPLSFIINQANTNGGNDNITAIKILVI